MKNPNAKSLAVPISELSLDAEGIEYLHPFFLKRAEHSFDILLEEVKKWGWVKDSPFDGEHVYRQKHNNKSFTLVLRKRSYELDGEDEDILDYLAREISLSKEWANHARATREYMEFSSKFLNPEEKFYGY